MSPVTDGQYRVSSGRFHHGHIVADAEHDSAHQVDGRDDQACHGISTDEFTRTVHGPIEFRFTHQVLSTLAGLLFVDEAGVQLGVNRHLLAG